MIFLTGATGLVGSATLGELAACGERVRVLTRSAEAAKRFAPQHIEVCVGDMNKPETLDFEGIDRAVLISAADPILMAQTQMSFIDAAVKSGVRHVVKLSCLNPSIDSRARFLRMHAQVESHLERSGMEWTHIRPSNFMQMYLLNAPSVKEEGSLYLPMGCARTASLDVQDLGKAICKVLRSHGHERKVYEMSGPQALAMAEVAEHLSKALGKEVQYVNISEDDLRMQLSSVGMSAELADAVVEIFRERRKGSESAILLEAHRELGVEPTTFESFVHRNTPAFSGAPRI